MGKLICTVELDKITGITVKVENPDDDIVQIIHMDGTKIETSVAKGTAADDKSIITQKFDSIAIKCKTYTLDAETITCKSTKASLHESEDTFDIKATKDLTEKSDAKVVLKATGDCTIDGANVAIKATTDLKLDGTAVKAKGTSEAKVEALTLNLKGTTKAELKGGMVTVAGDSLAEIKGAAVKLSGVVQLAGGGPPMMIG